MANRPAQSESASLTRSRGGLQFVEVRGVPGIRNAIVPDCVDDILNEERLDRPLGSGKLRRSNPAAGAKNSWIEFNVAFEEKRTDLMPVVVRRVIDWAIEVHWIL